MPERRRDGHRAARDDSGIAAGEWQDCGAVAQSDGLTVPTEKPRAAAHVMPQA